MMKFILMLMFLMPLSMSKMFWFYQNMLFMGVMVFLLLSNYSFEWSFLSYFMSMDLLSFSLILLTLWICSLMLMSSMNIYMKNNFVSLFIFMVWILMMFLIFTFIVSNLFLFYLFFECSLIPTLFLIMGWGFQLDRIQAGLYLLFYTLFASFPFLLSIMFLYINYSSLSFIMFFEGQISLEYLFMYLCLIMAFLVKMPMFFVHLWLPKAHVEAPVSGSMILAGIMLKLGGYGLLRVMSILLSLGMKFNYIWLSISILGGLMVSLICLFQVDLKSLIAYSSVAHMSFLLGGLMTLMSWGICGSFILMISHGLCSSGLFCLVNIVYERLGSRSILINKGLINFMPSLSLWWFLLCSSNMAAPPSMNLLGEIMLINSIISWSNLTLMFLIFLSFFSASYTLYLYSYTQHGLLNFNLYSFTQGYLREYMLLILHWIPLNFLIMNSEMFVVWI